MTNETSLINALERIGFTSVKPEELTIDEQVRVFSSARVIVGAVGAGLTNMGFAPPGCIVLEIMPVAFTNPLHADAYARLGFGWNLNLASILGHSYVYLLAEVDESRITPVDIGGKLRRDLRFEYEAPIPRVLETVERVLARHGIEGRAPQRSM